MRRDTLPMLICLALICLALTACGQESETVVASPQEPDSHTVGHYCGMTLKEHPGPKGQLLLKRTHGPLWFTSVRDALTYIDQDLPNEGEIAGFWVNDMAKGTWETPAPGSWIEAAKAWYVLGSSKTAAMGGGEAVPFEERKDAEVFAKEFGGRVRHYGAARGAIAKALSDESQSGGAL
jgi:copper chaperone NosL